MTRTLGLAVALLVVAGVVASVGLPPAPDGGTSPAGAETAAAPGGDRSGAPSLAFARANASEGFDYTSTFDASGGTMGNAGVYATDFDDDGWPDLLVTGAEEPVLFENTGGGFSRSGVLPPIEGYVKAAHFLDYDRDGDDDLLLLRSGDGPVFLENAGGSFERATVGLADRSLDVPTGAASADYDGDGCLDLFVFQNGDWSDGFPGNAGNRRAVLDGSARPNVTDGNPNLLFRGTCESFVNVTGRAGVRGDKWSLAASFVDLTGDGRPDVHVANDFSHDALYVNRGNGSFERVDLGPATDRNAMSSEVADANRDGRPDVFVTNIYFEEYMHLVDQGGGREVQLRKSSLSLVPEGNNLLINRGNGTFEDRASTYGVRKGGWGWAASIADLDNDGRRDAIHATSSDVPIAEYSRLGYTEPRVWEGTGTGFEPRNASALGFDETNGRGMVVLDYDLDGDLDVVIATAASWQGGRVSREPFAIYENVGAGDRSLSLSIERDGTTSIGARVTVTTDESIRVRIVTSRSDFLSQEPRTLHVGLGDERVERIRVVWPDGTERSFSTLPDGRSLVVTPDGVRAAGTGDG